MPDPLTIIAAHCYPPPPACFTPAMDAELRAVGIDQIQAAYLSVALEDAFGLSFSDAEVFAWHLVSDVVGAVEASRKEMFG